MFVADLFFLVVCVIFGKVRTHMHLVIYVSCISNLLRIRFSYAYNYFIAANQCTTVINAKNYGDRSHCNWLAIVRR